MMIFQTFKMNIYRIKDEHSFKKVLITYIIKLSHKMHGQQFMSFQFKKCICIVKATKPNCMCNFSAVKLNVSYSVHTLLAQTH